MRKCPKNEDRKMSEKRRLENVRKKSVENIRIFGHFPISLWKIYDKFFRKYTNFRTFSDFVENVRKTIIDK
jgi:hypothetical protein